MKKFLSIVLSLTMLFSLSSTAFATESYDYGTEKTLSKSGYSVTIYERVTDNYTTIRTYERDSLAAQRLSDLEETKAILAVLGMNEDRIEGLSNDTLLAYANADHISVSTTYAKYNSETDQTTYLPKSEALTSAEALDEEMTAYRIAQARKGQMPNESDVPGHFLDSIWKSLMLQLLFMMVRGYTFTTVATWLTMPWFRGNDSIGSCTLGATFTPNTAKGVYGYDVTYILPDGRVTHDSEEPKILEHQHTTKDGWNGYAGIFNLPNDGVNTLYDNLYAEYEYSGHVESPDERRWFNSIATYDHSLLTVDFDPSISIDTNGDVSAAIGISLDVSSDSRCAELEVLHTP